jgi:hypothetical protein
MRKGLGILATHALMLGLLSANSPHEIPNIKEKCDLWNEPPIAYVRQFTGLNDKNGQEIYEGDFVQHDDWAYPFQIIFDNGKSRFVCKMKTGLTKTIDCERLDVVGNSFENPELLQP